MESPDPAGAPAPSTGSWRAWHREGEPVRLGVSTCLLGEPVRYDGGHARNRYVMDVLGEHFEYVKVCPEVESGMPIPRPTIRLVDEGDGIRLVDPKSGDDHTGSMQAYSERRVSQLMGEGLDGYVLKKDSPSCGMSRIKVYKNGMPASRDQRGLFAAELLDAWPGLPVEEEGRLNDLPLREAFVERVFARHRWRCFLMGSPDQGDLVRFHTAHKMLLRTHDEEGYRRLGRIVGGGEQADGHPELDLTGRLAAYELEFQRTMAIPAKIGRHVNVLQHAMGYLKDLLGPAEKRELLQALEDYRARLVPLVVPLTLMRYEVRRHGVDYLAGQLYFDPHPKELMLRNHV